MVGPKNPANIINERRERVWHLMLKGHNAQSIRKQPDLQSCKVCIG
ncbi:MAG: hypothetical protein WBE34_05515 [Candidatus Nitrosopolaris sp.]